MTRERRARELNVAMGYELLAGLPSVVGKRVALVGLDQDSLDWVDIMVLVAGGTPLLASRIESQQVDMVILGSGAGLADTARVLESGLPYIDEARFVQEVVDFVIR